MHELHCWATAHVSFFPPAQRQYRLVPERLPAAVDALTAATEEIAALADDAVNAATQADIDSIAGRRAAIICSAVECVLYP